MSMNKSVIRKINIRNHYRDNEPFKFAMQVIGVIIGSIICGLCFPTFFRAADIIPSGLSGIALIIAEKVFGNAGLTSIVYLGINLLLFIVALRLFGWKYIVLSLIGLGFYTLSLQYFAIPEISTPLQSFPEFADYRVVYALIGGAISGLGQGLAFRMGGSTGGSDVLANIMNRLNPRIKTGVAVLIINIIVITITVITNGWQTALYAVIISVISTITCDLVLDGKKTVRAFYIICDKDQEISEKILARFHRGVTLIPAQGEFSKKEKKMLLCLVANTQAREMKEIVQSTDRNAFVFSVSVNETLGDGYFMREASNRKRKISKAQSLVKQNLDIKVMKNRPKDGFGRKFKDPEAKTNLLNYLKGSE